MRKQQLMQHQSLATSGTFMPTALYGSPIYGAPMTTQFPAPSMGSSMGASFAASLSSSASSSSSLSPSSSAGMGSSASGAYCSPTPTLGVGGMGIPQPPRMVRGVGAYGGRITNAESPDMTTQPPTPPSSQRTVDFLV